MTNAVRIPPDLQRWIDARKRFHLTHAQVQKARELGWNPRKLDGLANHRRERWKLPLPQLLEHAYRKRFGRECPERVASIEDRLRETTARKAARREERRSANQGGGS